MDTTLRDGEQTSGVSFAAHEKLSIAQALLDLGVNRLEIASARVSDGEFEAVKMICDWAARRISTRLNIFESLPNSILPIFVPSSTRQSNGGLP